ncbi:recombinase family protein [Chitinophaga rhizosphaerae]|uniref:recombinase family protein n=1 Tax=Chitinophaga rhizosphaerae TaxID=1864947 RepID=UPI000F8052B8|nr:recombinase family protein [Chitinophaga rhizosphaerae]
MKVADLYIRVSTDEQAEKGYSQRSQEEMLRRYCDVNKISIRKVIFEDHSAKTFDRPEWKRYLADLRRNKGHSDFVLFLKWDRFSRNAGDAYQMISTLKKLGVEPQAVEQPLDLSVPENKMMLAFYLAAPEVENDRRSLNVTNGMRRAMKEGRYMGFAPFGYVNKNDDAGKKFIAPTEPMASVVRWVFETISEGEFNSEQVLKMARERGYTRSKNSFWNMLRNPVYCGLIAVPKQREEEASLRNGIHEPLISQELFYDVQDVLDGRKRAPAKLKVSSDESLPLRGYLICPCCGRTLTGSASKGRKKYYAYYHCLKGCPTRFKAEVVNDKVFDLLATVIPRPEMLPLFELALKEAWYTKTDFRDADRKSALAQVKEYETRISNIREMLSLKQIDPAEFREMKTEYSQKLERLEAKLAAEENNKFDLERLLEQAIPNLRNLRKAYELGTVEKKRNIIGSLYPGKLIYDGTGVRTARLNEVISAILALDKAFGKIKMDQNNKSAVLVHQVIPLGSLKILAKSTMKAEIPLSKFDRSPNWSPVCLIAF